MTSLDASTYLLLAGLGLLVYVVVRRRLRGQPDPGRRPFETTRPLLAKHTPKEPPVELLHWQVEMHDTARKLKAELDSKLAALQALIVLAKRESERLETALHQAAEARADKPRDSLAVLERLGEPEALLDPRALGAAAGALSENAAPAPPDPFAGEQTELRLANLAAQGIATQEIARRLNMPLGEVELRMNLIPR